ncbi:MAG: DUF1553 domain-containing protein [Planctomycetaceae bacterium]|nr:DUF1553 domain-containing protein [Planctomycetaceae bacterium]
MPAVRRSSLVLVLIFVCWCALRTAASGDEGRPAVDYNRDVRPILSKACYNCHGPDAGHRKAGLRLDQRDVALKELETGARAIVPGNPDESELYRRITSTDAAERMPPKGTGHELTPSQIDTLRRWIKQEAPFAKHWSFVKPERPVVPAVNDNAWPRNPIDAFILSRLEQSKLHHAPEADRYALIRRLSLDLRGLPPTPQEVQAFVDDRDQDAYERLVDRFLDDSAYGERWARVWLDLARYADSKGLGSDPLRTIWRYRDWVIDAFNRNLPFDQFTIEQLAGDLLPEPTLEQRIATAFHRNTMTNTEGGTDDEEFRVAAVKDRVDTTAQVWMGLTVGCAKCHDHKFDPISQAEYYRFFAFFNQSADNDQPDESPTLAAPTPEIESQLREIDRQITAVQQQLDTPTPELAAAQDAWEETLHSQPVWTTLEPDELTSSGGATLVRQGDGSILVSGTNSAQDTYTLSAKTALNKITAFRLEALPDPSLPAGGSGRAADGNFVLSRFSVTAEEADQANAPIRGRFVRIELPGEGKILSLAEVQVFLGSDNLARAGKASQSSVDYDGPPDLAIDGNTNGDFFAERSTTHTKAEKDPWWEVDLGEPKSIDRLALWNRSDGDVGVRLANFRLLILDASRAPVWQQTVAESPRPGSEFNPTGKQNLALAQALADYSQPTFPVASAVQQPDLAKSGWAVGPKVTEPHTAYFIASAATPEFKSTRLVVRLEHHYQSPQYNLGRFRMSVTTSPDVLRRVSVAAEVLAIVDRPSAERTGQQAAQLAAHYRTIAPALQPLRDKIAQLEKSRPAIPTVPVMAELPADKRRTTTVMIKGNFLTPGEVVEAKVPEAFHPFPQQAPLDRLGIAHWIIARDNPLTARVMVNRFWSQVFGSGMVETEEDFGTQGELPSHPELLDWLAVEFMEPGPSTSAPITASPLRDDAGAWNMKRLLKLIVMSATYRQSSRVLAEALSRDPRNRLLTRGPRFRLEAEMVRDQALALAGLLSRKSHGPSVYPPQPPGLWQAAFNGERTWTTSSGEDKYRRGLYTLWRRTVPYPSMATFDAPSRELCTVRRIRTNTPLQAFVTLNDPVYVEAAQALARRIVREGGATADDRARFGLQLCLVRPPTAAQIAQLLKLYETELADYRQNESAAMQLATDPLGPLPEGMNAPELAAWTVVANVLLNLDGVMTK